MNKIKKKNVSYDFNLYKCCGCEICADICPTKAIVMKEDREGFKYPIIDNDKCINCGKCLRICPIRKSTFRVSKYEKPQAFAVKHKNDNTRIESRSGGIFTALSDIVLDNNGVIYGCILNEKFEAIHCRADNRKIRDLMRGSKYVQSSMKRIVNQVIEDLKNNKTVLFTGTACQVQGIRQAVPIKLQKNLLLIDIVCHGVPSPKIWKEYLNYIANKYNGKITAVDFRNKKEYGWKEHIESIEVNGIRHDSKVYTNLFYNHVIIRPTCFKCPYKNFNRPGDITIADFWGIDDAVCGFNDNKGVSLVLINNNTGREYFEKSKNDIIFEPVELEKTLQPPLRSNFIEPSNRKRFWKIYSNKGFDEAIKFYGIIRKSSIRDKIRIKLKNLINRVKAGN
mgnify:FL=1